ISNPPYFPYHIKSKDDQRNLALHNDAPPFPDLVSGAATLLSHKLQFLVILPERQMQDIERQTINQELFPKHKVVIGNHPNAPVLRVVQAFSFLADTPTETTLYIRDEDRNYSKAYKKLLKDFLLDF